MPDLPDTPAIPPQPPLRVGLIGVTGYAYAYFEELNWLAKRGLVEWGAVTIINRSEARKQVAFFESAKVPVYDDYLEMLDKESGNLDWVCIPTAIGWHARMTVDCLHRGLPVLLEKPVAPTLQDVEAIQAAERKTGLTVAVGFQHNYSPSTWEIKQRLLAGEIGDILRIDSISLWPRGLSYYRRNSWSGQLHDGDFWVLDSPLHNALSHIVNLILFFAGSTLERRADLVDVKAELYRAKPIQNFDTVWTEGGLDTGVPARVVLSHSSGIAVDPEIRITGSKGTLVWRFKGGHSIEAAGKVFTYPPEDQVKVRQHMFDRVVRRLGGDTTVPVCTTEQAKGEVKWINAVQDAAPVHDIPAAFRKQLRDPTGEVIDVITDLEAYALKAYKESRSLHDLGAPWAVPASRLDLREYRSFTARFLAPPLPSLEPSVVYSA